MGNNFPEEKGLYLEKGLGEASLLKERDREVLSFQIKKTPWCRKAKEKVSPTNRRALEERNWKKSYRENNFQSTKGERIVTES